MARRTSPTFTEVELEFMHIVWDRGEVTSDDILRALNERGRTLSDGSVRKILSILRRKGHLERRPDGRGFLYRASLPRAEAHLRMVDDLLLRAFDGSVSLMAAALLGGRKVDDSDLAEIKRLIKDYERREEK